MATLSVSEKTNFRVTSESLFNNLLGKIVDHQVRLEAQNLVNEHKNKWPQLYHERRQLDIDQIARRDCTRVEHLYEKLKNSVVTSQVPAAIAPPQLHTVQDYLRR